AYEDLRIATYNGFKNRIVSKTNSMVAVESVASKGSDSAYSKVKSYVSLPNYQLTKMEYWDDHGKLLKTSEFKGYQKVGNKYWRARTMEVRNVQNNRKTLLEVKKISLSKISDADISLDALAD